MLDKLGLGYVDRMPSAWDYIVREPIGSWVRIHLKDDRGIVAGKFGDRSVASLDPKRADVCLEEGWLLDEHGNFAGPVVDRRGVWIAADVMASVEFLDRWEEADDTRDAEHVDEGLLNGGTREVDGGHRTQRDPVPDTGKRAAQPKTGPNPLPPRPTPPPA